MYPIFNRFLFFLHITDDENQNITYYFKLSIVNPCDRDISRRKCFSQRCECPVPLLPPSPPPEPPGSPAGTAQAEGPEVWTPGFPPEQLRSTNPPAVSSDSPPVGCSPHWRPSIQNQGCQELRSGRWSRAYTSAALRILDTWRLPDWTRSFSSPGGSGTTKKGLGRIGCQAGTRSPSRVGWRCLPMLCPAGSHTWSHNAPQWWSMLEDAVCSSRIHLPPSSPGLGRQAEGREEADALSQDPCWLQHEGGTEHHGPGYLTATEPCWLL